MRTVHKWTLFGLLVLGFQITPSYAYQFEFIGIKEPVHQDMAEHALRCVALHPKKNKVRCENIDFSASPDFISLNSNGIDKLTAAEIREAVVWSDDPVRELRLKKPHKVLLWAIRLQENKCENLRGGLKDGLRCSTHYGPLQFMHSMDRESGIPARETQEAILDWVEYAYSVALNESKDGKYNNGIDYCSHFDAMKPGRFKNAMLPRDEKGEKEFPCNVQDDTPWKLGTPFAFSCWIGSAVCPEYSYENNYLVRKAALGAVLHAIQDSYAKGHVSRGNDTTKRINTYECAPIIQFQSYAEQDHDKHGKADETPTPSENCLDKNNGIHGPITASAEVIRLFTQGEKPKVVRDYLATHVFKLPKEANPSGTTQLFEPKGI